MKGKDMRMTSNKVSNIANSLLMLCGLSVALIAKSTLAAENLFTNGGFEEGGDGWFFNNYFDSEVVYSILQDPIANGGNVLEVDVINPGSLDGFLINFENEPLILESEKNNFKLCFLADGPENSSVTILPVNSPDSIFELFAIQIDDVEGSYQQIIVELPLEENAGNTTLLQDSMVVNFLFNQAGIFHFDDLKLLPSDGNLESCSTEYEIKVRARGTTGREIIRLTVGGTEVARWRLATNFREYTVSTALPGGINVEFINDADYRDVQLDHVVIGDVLHEAEDQTENNATWSGSCGAGQFSEWMHCNGFIGFSAYK